MPRVLYCARTCPPLEPPFPLPPKKHPPPATPSTPTRRHVNLDDPNSPTSPLPPDPNHQQPYYEYDSDSDEYCRPSSPEYDSNYSYDEDEGSFDPYHENLPYYANIALEHYNSQDKHQIKYRLVKGIVSHIIRYDGSYYHLNFTAKSTLENSKEEFFFAELRLDFDINAWVPVSIVALEENERVGGFGKLRGVVDPRHCFNCGDQLKHPLDGSLYEVSCKAYRHADPHVHTSMRHLFGTWKGVFSPQHRQVLHHQSLIPIPSAHPTHNIHVNPKYLVPSLQQLQQPIKGLLGTGAKMAIISDSDADMDRVNRIAIDKGAGRRLDALKPRAQRDNFSNPTHEKPDRDVRGLGFSNISQQPVVGAGQVRSMSKGQEGIGGPYYAGGVSSSEDQFDSRSSFYANKDPQPVRLDSAVLPTPVSNSDRIGRLSANKSWKKSEEEEYMWDDVRSQGADYAGASFARKGELMADDGNISSFHRTKWSELGDQLDPDFRKPDTIPKFGHETGQDRRIAAYMDHEEYLQSKRDLEPRIDREMWPEGQQFQEPRGSSLWASQGKTHQEVGRDTRISRFPNQSASITSSVPVGLSGAYAGRSSFESSASGPTSFRQQKHKYWPPSPPPAQAPSATASFVRQSSPSSMERDVYASRPFLPSGQNPQEEPNQRAHALPQSIAHSQGPSSQTQKHPSVLLKPHLKPPNHLFPQENSSSSLYGSCR